MQTYSPKQYIELFHLLFLDQLGRKLDKKMYVLKGGCNLRFYFNSFRYSEDIDIDIQIVAKDTLRKKVREILISSTLKLLLQSKKVEIVEVSEPRQTDTTQRWKIALKISETSALLHTKIEFSRRSVADKALFELVNPTILREYSLNPIMANHYSANTAFEQKIEALIYRKQMQARDIFDLFLLISQGIKPTLKNKELIIQLVQVQENILSITFVDYKGQVLAYLHPDNYTQYDSKEVWETIQETVINALEKIKP